MSSPEASITSGSPPIPDIDWGAVDPRHADLPYEERLLEAMTPRMVAVLDIGRVAYKAKLAEVGDIGTCGFAWVAIEITPETKPIIRWLSEEDVGRLDGWTLDYKVYTSGLLSEDDTSVQSLIVQEAGCEAFAAALRDIGVPCRVQSRVD